MARNNPMRLPGFFRPGASHAIVMVAALGLLPLSAQADPLFLPTLDWPGLPQDDLTRINAAAARLYEGRAIGTVERWRSPETKDAGEVKLVHSFTANAMPCRRMEYVIRFAKPGSALQHYRVNWCEVSPNTWKIVELGETH